MRYVLQVMFLAVTVSLSLGWFSETCRIYRETAYWNAKVVEYVKSQQKQ